MFAVTVRFEVTARDFAAFVNLVRQQAENSLTLEDGCHVFDVCVDRERHMIFLYEIYANAQAFDDHLASGHFAAFDRSVAGMIIEKQVEKWWRESKSTGERFHARRP